MNESKNDPVIVCLIDFYVPPPKNQLMQVEPSSPSETRVQVNTELCCRLLSCCVFMLLTSESASRELWSFLSRYLNSAVRKEKDINRLKEEEGAHEEVDIQSEEGRGADG